MPEARSFYLGPTRQRLIANSWNDIVRAAAAGVLDECHWVELKRDVPPAARAANLELAKDLASLSVGGGVLIVGIEDDRGRAGAVVGADLNGLADRVAQVASATVSPPLPVTTRTFPNPDDASHGIIVVTVPGSLAAPHMVDNRYWGRTDTGKRVLQDHEVRRLLTSRRSHEEGFEDRLRGLEVDLDPFASDHRGQGHLFLLIEPDTPLGSAVLSELVAPKNLMQLGVEAISFQPAWFPNLRDLPHTWPHPNGILGGAYSPEDAIQEEDRSLVALVGDDGSLRVVSGAGTRAYSETEAEAVVFTGAVLELVHSAVQIAAHLAERYLGYQGSWRAGLLIDKLEGRRTSLAYSQGHRFHGFGRGFPAKEYLRVTGTTTDEMLAAPQDVVRRLTERLLRSLGDEGVFLPYADPAELPGRIR